jgi:hypothetical protein
MDIQEVLRDQDGVISRRQVLACGESDVDIERRIRRREWARVHLGVFVDHTGPLSWPQRAWAAVLFYWPAALTSSSALRAAGLTRHDKESDPVAVVVAGHRRVDPTDGIIVTRHAGYDAVVMGNKSPPRATIEHAALTLAAGAATEDDAVAVLSDVCQSRRTSAARLLQELRTMPRLPHRRLLLTILEDVAAGAYSAFERRYLTRVERPHGLPTAARQRRVRPGKTAAYRDVDYLKFRTVIELDGRLGHDGAADKWADLDRDIDSLLAGDLTIRAGWGQVLQPCRLAAVVARILSNRGWIDGSRACGPDCPLNEGGSPAPGAGDPPLSTA